MSSKITHNNNNKIQFAFKNQIENKYFKANKGEIFANDGVISLGLGDEDKLNKEIFKEAICALGKFLKDKDLNEISINENPTKLDDRTFALSLVEALVVSAYDFNFYKSDKKENKFVNVNFDEKLNRYDKEIEELIKVLDGQFLARDLVNLRSNDIYPESLAQKAKENLSGLGVDVKVYNKDQILDMGLTADVYKRQLLDMCLLNQASQDYKFLLSLLLCFLH